MQNYTIWLQFIISKSTSQKDTAAWSLQASQTITYHDLTPEIHPQKLYKLAIRSGKNKQLDVRCVNFGMMFMSIVKSAWLCSRPM